ncbi:hypothetical protein Dda_8022 [Drechslerella dactyloides]|uniref:Uncharacterized protein n=1 Tax=Drechslerella dactyloides TaxID=74499 RepID=A0AAD6NGC4_DREDA|nr:hypothetical protein Dda_8022 [Drechslerella dactyloides]
MERNGSVAVKPVFLLGWGVEVFRSLRADHTSERTTSTPHPSKNTGFTATLPLHWATYMLVRLVTCLRCLLACSNVMPRLTTTAAANYPSRGGLWLGAAPTV